MPRERLPDRRKSWTQKVRVSGHSFYLTCGEYGDGRLGEIFITCDKVGTFVRGVLDGVARMASIALQCGASVEDVVKALEHANFPPQGIVEAGEGTSRVETCSSVLDWVAKEIKGRYLLPPTKGEYGYHTPGSGH
jgi:ribonucleoside-diphosphate reductase alpha chain